MQDTNDIRINLFGDWIDILRDELIGYGYEIHPNTDADTIAEWYLNLLKRRLFAASRAVHRADNFSCPPELTAGLSVVEQRIKNGEDLSPHLSRFLKRPDYNDPLLNHWGIHHLHLGVSVEPDGFVERTGPVLFARFDPDNAYLIGVGRHGSWAMQEFVRILHRNWPDSIAQFRFQGAIGIETPIQDSDVTTLRRQNVNTLVEVEPGVVYGALGGGITLSGRSVEVKRQLLYIKNRLAQMEATVVAHADEIRDGILKTGQPLPAQLSFRLEFMENSVYAVEQCSRLPIKLGPM